MSNGTYHKRYFAFFSLQLVLKQKWEWYGAFAGSSRKQRPSGQMGQQGPRSPSSPRFQMKWKERAHWTLAVVIVEMRGEGDGSWGRM